VRKTLCVGSMSCIDEATMPLRAKVVYVYSEVVIEVVVGDQEERCFPWSRLAGVTDSGRRRKNGR
jgi:hypothetical protein